MCDKFITHTHMHKQQRVEHTIPRCPLLLILEELAKRGWRKQRDGSVLTIVETPMTGTFSANKLASKCKPDFQTLVVLVDLFERGLTRYAHSQKVTYYVALLRSKNPGTLPFGAPVLEYENRIAESNDIVPPEPFEDLEGAVFSDHSVDVDNFLAESDEGEPNVPSEELAPGIPGPSSPGGVQHAVFSASEHGSAAGDAVFSASEHDGTGEGDDHPIKELELPFDYLDQHFKYDGFTHRSRESRSHARIVVCPLAIGGECSSGHFNCSKKRGNGIGQTARFGEWEPIAYLVAWDRAGGHVSTAALHRAIVPTEEAIEEAFLELKSVFPCLVEKTLNKCFQQIETTNISPVPSLTFGHPQTTFVRYVSVCFCVFWRMFYGSGFHRSPGAICARLLGGCPNVFLCVFEGVGRCLVL